MANIFDEFKRQSTVEKPTSTEETDVFNQFKRQPTPVEQAAPPVSAQRQALPLGRNESRTPGLIPSIPQGASDVINTVASGIGAVDEGIERLFKVKTGGTERNQNFQNRLNVENKQYDEKYKGMAGSDIGRLAGQMAVSGPLIPGAAIGNAMKTTFMAKPTILGATSSVKAAPIANRLSASVATGATVGGSFGALTSASNENSLSENVGMNALAGAVGGPVVEGAGALVSKVAPFIKSAKGNYDINKITNKYGITPQAAKHIVSVLDNEGMTLAEAEAKLLKFGPDATIGDLTPALQQFVGELAKRGTITESRVASIIKNRYANRADTADERALEEIVNKNLGLRKDVALERGKLTGQAADDIHEAAQIATAGDRAAAYANPTKLSVYSLIGEIDNKLEKVAGDAIPALEKARAALFKQVKDPTTGQKVAQVRNSVEDLHESRKALDDMIEKRGDSLPPRALAAVKDIRAKVDAQLKTIPEMKAHDEKFAKAMDIKEGLKIGHEALKKGNRFSFDRTYDAAPSEVQQTIREGMRAAIGDHMDMAAKGELSGAAQLFADRALTRHKLVKAFGPKGEEALEALEKHIVMRATEKFAATGSITGAALRTNAALDSTASPKSALMDAASGGVIDVLAGTSGSVAALSGAKRYGGNITNAHAIKRHDLNVESLADLVTRSGAKRDRAIEVLQTVNKVRNKLKIPSTQIKLPVVLSAPIGEPTNDKVIEGGKYGGKVINHLYNLIPDFK